MIFLAKEDLETLTGYRLPAKQQEWLAKNGIPHSINAAGRPVVLRAILERLHGLQETDKCLIDMSKVK